MPQNKKDPVDKAIDYQYQISIQQHHLFSAEYVKKHGMPTSGDIDIDQTLAKTYTTIYTSIIQMGIFLEKGATFYLVNDEDALPIFEIIVEVLKKWEGEVNKPFSPHDVPEDAMKRLDNLAQAIYPTARRFMSELPSSGSLAKGLDSITSTRGAGLLKRRVKSEEETELPTEYESIMDNISRTEFQKKKRWSS